MLDLALKVDDYVIIARPGTLDFAFLNLQNESRYLAASKHMKLTRVLGGESTGKAIRNISPLTLVKI